MTRYRERQIAAARKDLVRALEQLQWVCGRTDVEAALRCAYAAQLALKAKRSLERSSEALDPKLRGLREEALA